MKTSSYLVYNFLQTFLLELIRLEKRTKYLLSENYSLVFREFTASFKYIYYSLFNIINPVPWNLFSFDEGFLSLHWFAAFCVSKSIIHLFRRGTIFRFRHFTNCFLPLKNLLRIPHCVIRKQPPQKQDGKGRNNSILAQISS